VVDEDGHREGEKDEQSDHFVASLFRPYRAVLLGLKRKANAAT
jgi:hypothetical protein